MREKRRRESRQPPSREKVQVQLDLLLREIERETSPEQLLALARQLQEALLRRRVSNADQ